MFATENIPFSRCQVSWGAAQIIWLREWLSARSEGRPVYRHSLTFPHCVFPLFLCAPSLLCPRVDATEN